MSTGYYANDSISFLNLRFENDVNRYGTQTGSARIVCVLWFENDVNKYGIEDVALIILQNVCSKMEKYKTPTNIIYRINNAL